MLPAFLALEDGEQRHRCFLQRSLPNKQVPRRLKGPKHGELPTLARGSYGYAKKEKLRQS